METTIMGYIGIIHTDPVTNKRLGAVRNSSRIPSLQNLEAWCTRDPAS